MPCSSCVHWDAYDREHDEECPCEYLAQYARTFRHMGERLFTSRDFSCCGFKNIVTEPDSLIEKLAENTSVGSGGFEF